MPGESPMTLPCVSPASMIGLAYATEDPAVCPESENRPRYFGKPLQRSRPSIDVATRIECAGGQSAVPDQTGIGQMRAVGVIRRAVFQPKTR